MKDLRSLLLLVPAACLLGQTPPPKPSQPPPDVKLDVGNLLPKGPTVPPDRVVITVADTKITAAQFDRLIGLLPQQNQAAARGPGRKQFADFVVQILELAQEGRRLKLDQTTDYQTLVTFQQANVLAGLTADEIRKNLKPSDADLHKYYDGHKAEFEQVHARHILIRFQGSPVPVKPGQKDLSDAEALAKVQDLRKEIQGGADFAAVAKRESDDAASGANGGDLGTFHHGQMVPSFEQAAFALKPGDLSEPVKSQYGYHLIRVESHDNKDFEDVRADLENRLKPEQTKKAIDELQKSTPPVFDPEFFGLEKK
ncbi:MAG TPA: peptidylprolyl isomerase [Bryobacteraceae bacterium]|nr:peptidylprolyl isomerase [Bryobacteraceae bacterium]